VYLKISNAVGEDGNPLDRLRDDCTTHWYVSHRNADAARVRLLAIDGYETAAMDVQQRLAVLLGSGFFNQSPTPAVVDALVEAVRHAADSDDAQGRIGKNCLSVVVEANGRFHSADHRDDGIMRIEYMPPFVTGQVAYGQVSTRVNWVDSPSAHVPFEQWRDLEARTTIGRRAVRLENLGTDDLTDVRLDLNVTPRQDFQGIAKGWFYSTGYMYWFPRLRAGASETIPLLSFQKFEGTSFDPISQDLNNLTVTARLPNGEFGKYQAL
jgi:hypothetical protein